VPLTPETEHRSSSIWWRSGSLDENININSIPTRAELDNSLWRFVIDRLAIQILPLLQIPHDHDLQQNLCLFVSSIVHPDYFFTWGGKNSVIMTHSFFCFVQLKIGDA